MKTKQNVYDYSFEMRRKRREAISKVFLLIVSVFFFLTLFLNLVLFPVHVKSDTMSTDIVDGSALFVSPLVRTPKRGDVFYITRMDGNKNSLVEMAINAVVSFFTLQKERPFGHENAISARPFIRRVLGLPGDTIYMKDFVLYIKPQGDKHFLSEFELARKPYNVQIYSIPAEWNNVGVNGDLPETTLGDDEYFLLADNRVQSMDSRAWGVVPKSRFGGKVLMEYFPFNKLHIF